MCTSWKATRLRAASANQDFRPSRRRSVTPFSQRQESASANYRCPKQDWLKGSAQITPSPRSRNRLRSRKKKKWWARQDLNLGPTDYESAALTAELRAPRLRNILA